MSVLPLDHAYDHARIRRAVRKGREKGCWVYIPRAELVAAFGSDDEAAEYVATSPPPAYQLTGKPHSRNTGRVLVNLYREAS